MATTAVVDGALRTDTAARGGQCVSDSIDDVECVDQHAARQSGFSSQRSVQNNDVGEGYQQPHGSQINNL